MKGLGPDFDIEKPDNRENIKNIIASRFKKPLQQIRLNQMKRFTELNDLLNTFSSEYSFIGRKLDNLARMTKLIHLNNLNMGRQLMKRVFQGALLNTSKLVSSDQKNKVHKADNPSKINRIKIKQQVGLFAGKTNLIEHKRDSVV